MPIDPDEMSPDEAMTRLINAGLRMARTEGLGLGLFNAMRREHPDVSPQLLGQAVRTIGQGINAATEAREAGGSAELPIDSMPVLPNSFFGMGEVGRIYTIADVEMSMTDPLDPEGEPETMNWDVRTECGEGLTFDELIECIESHVDDMGLDDYPEDYQRVVNGFVNAYFMGKRF